MRLKNGQPVIQNKLRKRRFAHWYSRLVAYAVAVVKVASSPLLTNASSPFAKEKKLCGQEQST